MSRKTITWAELERLQFCNSKKLPQRVIVNGVLKAWTGIGWITLDEKPKPTDVAVRD